MKDLRIITSVATDISLIILFVFFCYQFVVNKDVSSGWYLALVFIGFCAKTLINLGNVPVKYNQKSESDLLANTKKSRLNRIWDVFAKICYFVAFVGFFYSIIRLLVGES